jgi:hypothetical protein
VADGLAEDEAEADGFGPGAAKAGAAASAKDVRAAEVTSRARLAVF